MAQIETERYYVIVRKLDQVERKIDDFLRRVERLENLTCLGDWPIENKDNGKDKRTV